MKWGKTNTHIQYWRQSTVSSWQGQLNILEENTNKTLYNHAESLDEESYKRYKEKLLLTDAAVNYL